MDESLNDVALGTIPCEMSVFTNRRQDVDPATINWTIQASLPTSTMAVDTKVNLVTPQTVWNANITIIKTVGDHWMGTVFNYGKHQLLRNMATPFHETNPARSVRATTANRVNIPTS